MLNLNSNPDSISSKEPDFSIGFTGTKMGMKPKQLLAVHHLLMSNYDHLVEFHHGDCIGADFEAAKLAYMLGFVIVCHPPIKDKNRAWFRFNHRINPEYDYIVRDRHIVDDTRVLIAAPNTSYEMTRSGTWTTVRYARQKKRNIVIVFPDGNYEWEHRTKS